MTEKIDKMNSETKLMALKNVWKKREEENISLSEVIKKQIQYKKGNSNTDY